jgi:hypothetical protein
LIDTIALPLADILHTVYRPIKEVADAQSPPVTPPTDPDKQNALRAKTIVKRVVDLGLDLPSLLSDAVGDPPEGFISLLKKEWESAVFQAVATVVTGSVPVIVNAVALVAHFVPTKP